MSKKEVKTRINTVVFDLGNVLVDFSWQKYLASFGYDRATYDAVASAVFLNPDWEEGDRGIVTGGEWLRLFLGNAPEYEKEIREVYEKLEGCIERFPYTEKLIAAFRKKGFRIFYLSNYSEYLYEKTKETLSFIETFDGGLFSYREKCMKPDKTIYKSLLERYDIKAEDTLFFDDRLENVEAAKELGINGILFTPEVVKEYL